MTGMFVMIGATLGGYVGWWLGERFGLFAALMLSLVGTAVGVYFSRKIARDWFGQ